MKLLFLCFLTILLPLCVLARSCPWQKTAELTLMQKPIPEIDRVLTKSKLVEDMDCLQFLLQNVYLVGINSPQIPLHERLEQLKKEISPRKSLEFMNDLFLIHMGLTDLHLSYSFNDQQKRFSSHGTQFGFPGFFKKSGNLFERMDEPGNSKIISCDFLDPVALNGIQNRYILQLRAGVSVSAPINCTLENGKIFTIPQAYPIPGVIVTPNNFPQDKIHFLASNIVYLRPGNLLEFTPEQEVAIEFIRNHDMKLIIDLVSNPGGDNEYANRLAKAIYTSNQKIPSFTSYEIISPLKILGLVNTLLLIDYPQWANLRQEYIGLYRNLSIDELAPYTVKKVVHEFIGQRPAEYQSEIVLLTSSECSSGCETFVEQLSWHPKVLVLGKNTAGIIHYGNAASFILPNSKVRAYIPSYSNLYENEAPEGVGYPVKKEMDIIDLSKPELLFSP